MNVRWKIYDDIDRAEAAGAHNFQTITSLNCTSFGLVLVILDLLDTVYKG